jgi:hypothetical protein
MLDSATAVEIAVKAVDARTPQNERSTLEVYSVRADSLGFHVSVVPTRTQLGGGGRVWIGSDGAAVKEVVLGQ